MLLTLKAWLAKSRWAVWVVVGFLVVVLGAILRGFFDPSKHGADPVPPVPKAIQDKVDRAEEDGLKARVEASVRADEQKKAYEAVLALDDGAERRKRLAELLAKL